jgi:hypothetical protein
MYDAESPDPQELFVMVVTWVLKVFVTQSRPLPEIECQAARFALIVTSLFVQLLPSQNGDFSSVNARHDLNRRIGSYLLLNGADGT